MGLTHLTYSKAHNLALCGVRCSVGAYWLNSALEDKPLCPLCKEDRAALSQAPA